MYLYYINCGRQQSLVYLCMKMDTCQQTCDHVSTCMTVSDNVCGGAKKRMAAEGIERRALLRDQKPLVKNTTNQIKDLFLRRAVSSFLLSGGIGQPWPPAQDTLSSLLLQLLHSL